MRSLILAILVVLAGSAYGQLDGEPRQRARRFRPVSTTPRPRATRARRHKPRRLADMSRRSLRHKVLADVNGDGRRDLVRVHRVDYGDVDDDDDDTVLPATIELNTSQGFLPPREITATYLTAIEPTIQVVDLNDDGRDDLILIDNDERNPVDQVWLSNGRGFYDPGLSPAVCALSRAHARDLRGCRSRTSSRL